MRALLTIAFVLLAGLASAAAQAPEPEPLTAYVGTDVIDVRTGATNRDQVILVRGDRIEALLPPGARAKLPDGTRVVDVKGLYAAPGLIDTHQHVAMWHDRPMAEAYLRREIYSGVTAIRDVGGDARLLAYLQRASLAGEIAAPEIDYAAMVAGPAHFSDHRLGPLTRGARPPGEVAWLRGVDASTDLRQVVAEAKGTGASALKIYTDMPPGLVRAVTAEAHRQGLKVWAHAVVFPQRPSDLVRSGVDTVSHVCMLAYEVSRDMPARYAWPRAPVDEVALAGAEAHPAMAAVFDEMARRGIVLDATLFVYDEIERRRAAETDPAMRPPTYCSLDLSIRLTAQARSAGVPVSTGTDAYVPATSAWPAVFNELDLLGKAGFTPLEALQAATLNGARALGRDDLGAIEPGKLANIAFFARDPLQGGDAFRSVVLTVKRGVDYRRADYTPVKAEELTEGWDGRTRRR